MSQDKELKKKIDDTNLQFIVLLQIIIEKIEFLETQKYFFGSIKSFLKNGKVKFENFINLVFKLEEKVNENSAMDATNKLLVMQERVELALMNQYMLTVDERRDRTKEILSKYLLKPMVDKAVEEMEDKNLFNF
jgi:hypothetical protein